MNSSVIQNLFIDGPAGKLEVILGEPRSIPKGLAIIAHPHPLHGGTMDNKVIHTLFTTLLELEFVVAKFNFRGVGKSEGVYDHGRGETEDAITIAQMLRHQFSDHTADLPLLLAGF